MLEHLQAQKTSRGALIRGRSVLVRRQRPIGEVIGDRTLGRLQTGEQVQTSQMDVGVHQTRQRHMPAEVNSIGRRPTLAETG